MEEILRKMQTPAHRPSEKQLDERRRELLLQAESIKAKYPQEESAVAG